jgi:glycosyltransferase involved in cell wall biosynthesis
VRIVPHGIDPELFRPERPPLKIDGLRTIRFLSVAGVQSNDQKNWRGLLRAWADAFAPGDDVCLIAHGYPGCENELAAMIRDHFAARESAPVIMLRHSIDMPRLYATADVFALASKGEGFCLAALEAAASGLFIVAPRSTGLTDFLDDETARLVKVKREPVLDLPPLYRAGDSHWYPPVHDDLVDALRGAAEAVSAMPAIGFGRTRTDQGMRASSRVRERFTWDRAAEQAWVYLRLLNGWRERKSVGACPQTATAGG